MAYWNPSNVATGNYTVKATFTEEKYMGLNNHPHPYGLFIGGSDMGTDTAVVPVLHGVRGRPVHRARLQRRLDLPPERPRGEANAAINKASGVGASVTQEIALSVKGDKIECAINGQVVGSYDKSAAVGAQKLKSTDGVYGIRFGHNTDAVVKGLALTKN